MCLMRALQYRAFAYGFIIFIIILAFPRPIFSGFTCEDYIFIERAKSSFSFYNTFIREFAANRFYRPITRTVFYLLSYKLFNLHSEKYYILTKVLFILNCLILFEIAAQLMGTKRLALAAPLFYASRIRIHDMPTYLIPAGFQESGMAFFMLSAILAYVVYVKHRNTFWYIASLTCALLATLSKEASISLPFLVLLVDIYLIKGSIQQNIKSRLFKIAPFFLFSLIQLTRWYVIQSWIAVGHYSMDFTLNTLCENIIFSVKNLFNGRYEILILVPLFLIAYIKHTARRDAVILALVFFVSLLPFIFLKNHLEAYYLSISAAAAALIFATGLRYFYEKFFLNKYILPPLFAAVFIITANYDIVQKRKHHELYSAFIAVDKIAQNVLTYFKTAFPSFPDNSLIYIQNDDSELSYALGGGAAIRLNYKNTIAVYFEGTTQNIPLNYSNLYCFKYHPATKELKLIDGKSCLGRLK